MSQDDPRPDPSGAMSFRAVTSHEVTSRTTGLLRRLREGDAAASEELMPIVFAELHSLAKAMMDDERRSHTLQPTALLNEAWLRLMGSDRWEFEDRAHFVRLAARAMRNVLVDHARARRAAKRGAGAARADVDVREIAGAGEPGQLLEVHEALEALARLDPATAEIVELRFFGGLTLEETARVSQRSVDQIFRSWTFARGWLRRRIEAGSAP
jgi:RNA polymerase sigma factor (TIGR02999 family)